MCSHRQVECGFVNPDSFLLLKIQAYSAQIPKKFSKKTILFEFFA